MGSDHYCLRWNNHQSNLLGVFSQLLRDESLVDVTLACSEGHSIRAHKVVLSACSSYFQTLFVDHPARHPIVILKDVRFAELSTLVEFMYHGEVNVEHCQLSELLRTAESLKVKGLTDMTNLGPPPVNLQAPTQHGNTSSASTTTTTTTTTCCKMEAPDDLAVLPPEQTEPTELLNKKPSAGSNASLTTLSTNIEGDPMVTATTTCTTTKTTLTTPTSAAPISLVSSDRKSIASDPPQSQQHQFHMQQTQHSEDQSSIKDSPTRLTTSSPHAAGGGGGGGGSSSIESDTLRAASPTSDMDDDLDESDDEEEEEAAADDYKPSDMRLIAAESSQQRHPHHHESAVNSVVRVSDLGNAIGLVLGRLPSSAPLVAVGGSEPIAGPSNVMPPVQQVPLSLKKEVDWGGGGSADEKSNIESPSDYPRHSLDPDPTTSEGIMQQAAAILQAASTSASRGDASATSGGGGGPAHLYQCIYCSTTFPHQSKLTRHILSHSLETLKYREQLAAQHSPLLTLGVSTTQPSDTLLRLNSPLNLIEPTHTPMEIDSLSATTTANNDTPGVVLCKFCGKSFPDVSSLIGHLPVHTGDRPFKCEFCGKAFKLRHHMKDHCRVHTGERPFRCSLCGKTFSRSTILKAHEKTHYPKYVRKFLSPSPLDTEEESPHSVADVERCFVTTSPASSTRSPRSPQHSSRSSTPATFTLGGPQHPSPGPGAAQLPSSVSIAAAVVGYHQQRHHNLATSLLEAGLVHPALFNAAAAAAAVAAAGGASAGEDLYRCGACMAAFPSIWLLEQHTALQHIGNLAAASTSSSSIDKPFVCEQCGQSYRYRSAYVKHREQNHRARLPADKLFSCDFCGMQFRYLKSFKKHRLNHALERLHGKANSETRIDMICGSGIPSGSKETTTSRGDCAPIENSSDQVSSSNETLTVIDDQPMTTTTDYPRHSYRPDNRGATDDDNDTEENPSTSGQREHIVIDSDPMQLATTSDEEHEEADDQDDTIDSVIKETSKSPAPSVSGVKYAPLTAAGSSLVNVRASTSTGLAATSDLSVAIAGGSAPAASTMATVDAVEAFRSAQQASIINFLRADAAERQRERRFACPFCGKCVRSKENLKLHVRKHTGERPFVCLFCGRAFGGKSDLTRHLRIHTGERPYHCDMCGKCFARADYLSKHLTTHINAPR